MWALLVILLVLPSVFTQTVSDPCTNYHTLTGILGGDELIPEMCWRIQPTVGNTHQPVSIAIYFAKFDMNASYIELYEGADTSGTLYNTYTDSNQPPTQPITITATELFVYLRGDVECSFDLEWRTGPQTQLKTALMMLSGVIIMFAIPGICVCASLCFRTKETKKKQAQNPAYGRKRQTVSYWLGVALGLIIFILILARKINMP